MLHCVFLSVAGKHRFGEKATPGLVNEKAKRALQNLSDERRMRRVCGRGVDSADIGEVVGRDSE